MPEAAEMARTMAVTARILEPFTDKQGNIDILAAANAIRLGKENVRKALIDAGYKASDIKTLVTQSKDNIFIGDQMMPIKTWNTIPEQYQTIALKEGWGAMSKAIDKDNKALKEWESNHKIIGNQAMPLESTRDEWGEIIDLGWNDLAPKYQTIALKDGWGAVTKAVNTEKAAHDKALIAMEPYKTPEGYNITLALADDAIAKKELTEIMGFESKDVDKALATVNAARETNVAVLGQRTWMDVKTHKIYTDAK